MNIYTKMINFIIFKYSKNKGLYYIFDSKYAPFKIVSNMNVNKTSIIRKFRMFIKQSNI